MSFNAQRVAYEQDAIAYEHRIKELFEENEILETEIRVLTETIQAIKEMEIRKKIAGLLLGE